jgi:hypothetical protein
MINIDNKKQISDLLQLLNDKSKPTFGNMSAQQMVEHLILSIRLSMGELGDELYIEESKAAAIKRMIIHTDRKLPIGFKVPILPETPVPCIYPNISTSIQKLFDSISSFESYYQQNPSKTHVHPTMGSLNYMEWKIMHGKHLAHHFSQFGLI